jgi:DNA-binding transcriptional MerR regulator
MQPKELAQLLGVTSNTIRRWCDEFHKYLTPTASPPKGKQRVLAEHDQRVLHYVAVARDAGQPVETIVARLDAMLADSWNGLPERPSEWDHAGESIPLPVAASRAYDVSQVAVLQREVEHLHTQLTQALERAESAENRVQDLQQELESQRASGEAIAASLTSELHSAQLELEQAKGEAKRLEGQLQQYSLGRDKPINVGLIILVTAVSVAVLVIVLLVVVRLVL